MRLAICAMTLAAAAFAAGIVESVRDGLRANRGDAELAAIVRQAGPSGALDDAAIEALESEGAGLLTVEALERLRDAAAMLPAPPSTEDQKRTIDTARALALEYTASLPNFLCTEKIERYHGPKQHDTLTVDLAFSEKGEHYVLRAIDGKPTNKDYNKAGGFKSQGEFGSLLRAVFEPKSATDFQWERWTMLRGRVTSVHTYRIALERSTYSMHFDYFLKSYKGRMAMRGAVYIDRDTSRVMRLISEADGIPANWPILRTPSVLDYDNFEIGGQRYLLPRRVDTRVISKSGQSRNVTTFTAYRKFAGEATVTFGKMQ